MEFKIKQNQPNYKEYNVKALTIARHFSEQIYKEMGGFIKVVSLFGSSAKKKEINDIDILVIVDDVSMVLGEEVAETYKIVVEKIVSNISKKLHITTIRLSTFWEHMRVGDPIGINMIRDGIPLIDTNIFEPMKHLLQQGRIRPSKEAIWTYFMKVPASLKSSTNSVLKATIDLYWAVMDASHSVLMSLNLVPPSPEHVSKLMKKLYLDKKLRTDHSKLVDEFYTIMKNIEHGKVTKITGKQYDLLYKKAVKFSNSMKKIVSKLHPEL